MPSKDGSVQVRFAPSPTGYLHVGSLRTALYSYLFARKHGGKFILRIEDTDRARLVPDAIENLVRVLRITGITYDEGPYIQSERLDIYAAHAKELLETGKAYRCFCSSERLEAMRAEQVAQKQAPRYDRYCLNLSAEEVQSKIDEGAPHVVRFRMPEDETIVIRDIVRGEVSFRTDTLDDQVLLKSDGFPTYHLAVVVDDHLMAITHVIRGEEWLPSTPKHLLLYRAFGWEEPEHAHIPLLLNPDKSKLSKRQGDVAVEDYLKQGYLAEALINFVALLGWNPGKGSTQEIFSLDELVEAFDLSHVHKAGAVFDPKKLDWINAQYIKKLTSDELYAQSLPFLESKDFYQSAPQDRRSKSFVKKLLAIEQERLIRLNEVGEQNRFFFVLPDYARSLLRWKENSDVATRKALERALGVLGDLSEENWTRQHLQSTLLEVAGERRGDFLWPLRVALSGFKYSPSPADIAWALGKTESLARISRALEKIEK